MSKKLPKPQSISANSEATIAEKNLNSKNGAKTQKKSESVKPEKAAVNAETSGKKTAPKKNIKTNKAADKKPNVFKRMWKAIKGTFSELKKVTWPKGKDVLKSGTVVIMVVFAFFIILFGIDYLLTGILSLIANGTWATIFIGH